MAVGQMEVAVVDQDDQQPGGLPESVDECSRRCD